MTSFLRASDYKKAAGLLKRGEVGIVPTDTLYGVVGRAFDENVVERIYKLKGRDKTKPFIILISSLGDLELFGIEVEKETSLVLEKYWPGKVSVILPCDEESLSYLHRGTNSLAFRLPRKPKLEELIKKTGPLVAPSANPEDAAPALSVGEASDYFGEKVDFYLDEGVLESLPSSIIKMSQGKPEVVRDGAVKIR